MAPSTPYGLRARQQRAANTPGRDRRRSGRMQRETTFDILKNLGKGMAFFTTTSVPALVLSADCWGDAALAPVSKPIQSSPQEEPEPVEEPRDEFDELDNEPEIERPRLSLPIQEVEGESDEASPEMRPPRMSLAFEDDDITYQSVEYPRDLAIRDRDRLSMMSRGTARLSEDFGQLENDFDAGEETGLVGDDEDAPEDTMISGGDFDRG